MDNPIYTFGEYLTQWMTENNHTAATLCLLTGTSSASAIARMMRDQLGYQRCARFINELSDAVGGLCERTLREMRSAVEVTRYGKSVYTAKRDFLHMLGASRTENDEANKSSCNSISQRLHQWSCGQKLSILCLGLSDSHVFRELSSLSSLMPDAQIIQYLEGGKIDQLSALLGGALGLAFKPNYEMYALNNSSEILVKNVLVAQRKDGAQLIMVFKNGSIHTLPIPEGVPFYQFCHTVSCTYCMDAAKINRKIRSDHPEDYAMFLEECATLEKDIGIYQIKSDVGLEYIPVELLISNYSAWAENHDACLLPYMGKLTEILRRRHLNLLRKTEPTYLLMTKASMRSFAETGRLSDHPFCLNPFSPAERRQILRHLIEMAAVAAKFVPLFFEEEQQTMDYAFIGYESGTLLVCPSNANYNLANYTEFIVSSDPLLEQFKSFYMNMLVKSHAISKKASLDFLITLEASIRE